jgi:hypothetical protein
MLEELQKLHCKGSGIHENDSLSFALDRVVNLFDDLDLSLLRSTHIELLNVVKLEQLLFQVDLVGIIY